MAVLAAGGDQRAALLAAATLFPPPPDGARFLYGTAGFRAEGAAMGPAVCRAGVVAALRSAKLGGAAVGVVITASHNPVRDNGVKIVDADGGMLSQDWEPFADALANAPNPDALLQVASPSLDLSLPHALTLLDCVLQLASQFDLLLSDA
jgi:phosphoacetylglucosamine mutase